MRRFSKRACKGDEITCLPNLTKKQEVQRNISLEIEVFHTKTLRMWNLPIKMRVATIAMSRWARYVYL